MSSTNSMNSIEIVRSGILAPIKKWGTKWSLWPVHLVTACCGAELAHAFASGYDGERIGALNYGIARQTNLIIVEGAITRKMARVLRITWEQMPDPKFVIVMGACGLNGGLFWNGYHLVKPSDVVPVEYFIPGCPPTPEGLLRGIRSLQEKIWSGKDKNSIEFEKLGLERKEIGKRVPSPPKNIAKNPFIKVDVEKKVNWDFGDRLVNELNRELGSLVERVTITGKNRICIRVDVKNLQRVAVKLKDKFDHVKSVNVIDVPYDNTFIVEYVLSSYSNKELMPVLLTIATKVSKENPKLPSLHTIWISADYLEREIQDLFGVVFEGNPWGNKKFLLAPDTPEHPLRKDFKLEEDVYVRLDEQEVARNERR